MQSDNINKALRIAYLYVIRNAFKLFDAESRLPALTQLIYNLFLTSKSLKNSICDKLWLEMMHRWMHGRVRCKLVSDRIESLLQKNDKNGLMKFMEAVWNKLARRESNRLLTNYLIKITKDHKDMLLDYIEFFKPWNRHMTMKEYRRDFRDFPFLGFKPEHVEKAMQIANENGWIDECLILFDHFCSYYLDASKDDQKLVRSAIESGKKLNFDRSLARIIQQTVPNYPDWYQHHWLGWYLGLKQITTENLMEVLYDVTEEEGAKIQSGCSFNKHSIVSFEGSRLVLYRYNRRASYSYTRKPLQIQYGCRTYTGLQNEAQCSTVYIYYYYRALIWNDIERAKQIQSEHGITLSTLSRHPHPVTEYLNYTKTSIDRNTIYYLIENFDVKDSLKNVRTDYLHKALDILKLLIAKGAIVHNYETWEKLFFDQIPRSEQEFQSLLDVTSVYLDRFILGFLFDKFRPIEEDMMRNTKILVLLAWKYDNGSNLFSTLPKEILQIILKFLENQPLHVQYAHMIMKRKNVSWFDISTETVLRSRHIARFIRDNFAAFRRPWQMLPYSSMKTIKRDAKYIEEIYIACINAKQDPAWGPDRKIITYFCKYGTNEQILQQIEAGKYAGRELSSKVIPVLEYAAVAKNINFLKVFFDNPANQNTTLDKEKFNEIARKRKYTISFEEAVALVEKARQR